MKRSRSESANSKGSKSPIEVLVAKYGLVGAVMTSLLGLFGIGLTAYFAYLGVQAQVEAPIRATQTAEARISPTSPGSSSTSTTTPSPTNAATETATSVPVPSPTHPMRIATAPMPSPDDAEINGYTVVQPSCNCRVSIFPHERILVRLRWGAKTADLAEKGASVVKYELIIDGKSVEQIEQFRKQAVYVANPVDKSDPHDSWWVYWDYPIDVWTWGNDHIIESTLTVPESVDIGWNEIPAGTKKAFSVFIQGIALAPPPPPPE